MPGADEGFLGLGGVELVDESPVLLFALTAAITYLSGARHDSKRGVEEVVEALFGVPVALGTVAAAERELSAALADAHAAAVAAGGAAPGQNVGETGREGAGRRGRGGGRGP